MIRLYLTNRISNPWAVDAGPGTPVANFDRVLTEMSGHTMPLPGTIAPVDGPSGWLEFTYGTLVERNQTALILKGSSLDGRIPFTDSD